MARTRRKSRLTRNKSIALAISIVAFVGIGLIVTGIGIESQKYQGTKFSVQIFENVIPLALSNNFAIQCSMWTQGDLVFTDGTKRNLGFDTQVFTNTAFLSVFDPVSQKEVSKITGEIRARCSSNTPIESFILTGGKVDHFWQFEKTDDLKTQVKAGPSKSLSQSTNLLQASTGSGILLTTFSISASEINNAIATNAQEYFVNINLWTEAELNVQAKASGITSSGTSFVGLSSFNNPKLTLKVTNTNTGNIQQPLDNRVIIKDQRNSIISKGASFDIADTIKELFLSVQLPSYSSFESIPRYEIFKADSNTGAPVGSVISSGNVRESISSDTWRTFIDLSSIQQGVYTTVASSPDRTGTDRDFFLVQGPTQSGTVPISPDPDTTQDPCTGLTGSALEQCEITKGQLLSCSSGYTKLSRQDYNTIAGTAGVIINIQPGTSINQFTTEVCLSNQSIKIWESLGGDFASQCTATNFIFDTVTNSCVCKFTGLPDTQTCEVDTSGVLSAQSIMLYEIVYQGKNDVGSIKDIDAGQVFFGELLNLAGSVGGEDPLYTFARLHVSPVIDVTNIPTNLGDPKSAIFTFEWTGAVTRAGTNEKIELGTLEKCIPTGFNPDVDPTKQSVSVSPVTDCKILDMNSVSVTTGSGNLGLRVDEKDTSIQGGRFFQIARSDIQPNEISNLLSSKTNPALKGTDILLNDGDKFELTVEVQGSFKIGTGATERIGVVAPMRFSHEFTWAEALGEEPCKGLSGEAKIRCLGGSQEAGGTCEGLTSLQCWQNNHPVLPKTNADDPDCRNIIVGTKVVLHCQDEELPPVRSTFTSSSDPKGSAPEAGFCPEGTTASACSNIILEIVNQKLAGLLGLGGSGISAISNNAILIIALVVIIVIAALVIRQYAVKRNRNRFRGYGY